MKKYNKRKFHEKDDCDVELYQALLAYIDSETDETLEQLKKVIQNIPLEVWEQGDANSCLRLVNALFIPFKYCQQDGSQLSQEKAKIISKTICNVFIENAIDCDEKILKVYLSKENYSEAIKELRDYLEENI